MEHMLKLYSDGIDKGEIMPEMTIQSPLTALLYIKPQHFLYLQGTACVSTAVNPC